jgi:hypothetical protein
MGGFLLTVGRLVPMTSLRQRDREFEALRAQARQANPGLYRKIEESKKIENVSPILNP